MLTESYDLKLEGTQDNWMLDLVPREDLIREHIDKVFNFFAEAGIGFAEDSLRLIERDKTAEG